MNKHEQEYYRNIERITIALEKIERNTEKIVSNTFRGLGSGGPVMVKKTNRIKHI